MIKKILAITAVVTVATAMLASCGGNSTSTSSGRSSTASITTSTVDNTKIEYEKIGEASVRKDEPDLGSDPSAAVRVISFTLSKTELSLHIGKKGSVEYTIMPEKVTDPSIYWQSANESIAKVDKDGNILGVGVGITTVSGETTDGRIKKTITVAVSENEGNSEKVAEMVKLINDYRVAEGKTELSADNIKLNGMANHRIYEEGVEFVTSKYKSRPDATRPDGSAHETVYKQFDLSWARQLDSLGYVYDKKLTAENAFKTMTSSDSAKAVICGNYDYVGVGYYERDGYTFWTVWFVVI